jgi:hypothetical protein
MTKIQKADNKLLTAEAEVESAQVNHQPSSHLLTNSIVENINEIASKAAFQSHASGTLQSRMNIQAQQLNDLFSKLPAFEAKLEENSAKVTSLSNIIENESHLLDEITRKVRDPESEVKFNFLSQTIQEVKQDLETLKLAQSKTSSNITELEETMSQPQPSHASCLDCEVEHLEEQSNDNTQNDIAGLPSIEDIRRLNDDLAEVNHSLQNVSAMIAGSLGEAKEFAEQNNAAMLQVIDGFAQTTQLAQQNAELALEHAQASAESNQAAIKTLEAIKVIEKTAEEIQQISAEDNHRLESIVRAAMNHRPQSSTRPPSNSQRNLGTSNELSTVNNKDDDSVIVKIASDNCFVAFFQKFHEFLSRIISFIFCSCTPVVVYRSIVPIQ